MHTKKPGADCGVAAWKRSVDMERVQSVVESEPAETSLGHSEGSWLAAGAALPCFDAGFYMQAGRRKARHAIYFILLFGAVVGTLSALGMLLKMLAVQDQIRTAYAEGAIPAVTIHDGVATAKGPMPAVILNQGRTAVIVDTSGKITQLDPTRYDTGFLLTRTYLQIVSENGRNQVLPLAELNDALKTDPLVVDGESVSRLWGQFSFGFGALYWVGAVIWDAFVRLGYLALLALALCGILRLFQPRAAYAPVFIVGAYAFAPAQYLSYLLGLVEVHFVLLQTGLWAVIWVAALYLAYRKSKQAEEGALSPFWTWRTWLILALLALMAANVVFSWEFGGTLLWAATAVALLAIVVGEMVKTLRGKE
jgi:hypothetical protein